MERLRAYIKESYDELVHHVTWPNLHNLQSTTMLVIISAVIIALIIFLMDVASSQLVKLIYGI